MEIFSDKKKLIQYLFGLAFVLLIASLVVTKLTTKHYTPVEKAVSAYEINSKFIQAISNYSIIDEWIKKEKKNRRDDDSLLFKYKIDVPEDLPIALLVNEITDSLGNAAVKIKSQEIVPGGETRLSIYSGDNLKLRTVFSYNKDIKRKSDKIGIIIDQANGIDKEEFQQLLKLPERFCFLITPSKSNENLLKDILQDQKEFAVLITDKNTDLEYKFSRDYSTNRTSNSIKAILSDFSNAAFIVLDDVSGLFKSSNMSYIIGELEKRNITFSKLHDFNRLSEGSEIVTAENFKRFVINDSVNEKKILMLSVEQYFTVKDQLILLRKKGYRFMRPSAL